MLTFIEDTFPIALSECYTVWLRRSYLLFHVLLCLFTFFHVLLRKAHADTHRVKKVVFDEPFLTKKKKKDSKNLKELLLVPSPGLLLPPFGC